MQEIECVNQLLIALFGVKFMRQSFISVVSLIVFLYMIWAFSVFAEPPFPDMDQWQKTDFSAHSVPLEDMIEGGPGKDGIQSIDAPEFESTSKAAKWLNENEPVIAFIVNGKAKAYPLQILMYHEIVNDQLGDQKIAVTYCPLCNAAMIFSRSYSYEDFDFGTTGKVYTSNLVMYDRQSETWWLQFTGEAVVGEYTGKSLELLPSQIVSFEHFKNNYPDGLVLSRNTGFDKKYGVNPYTHYDSRSIPIGWFFRKPFDDRLPAMERVLGVATTNEAMAFPFSSLNTQPLVHTDIGEEKILVISKPGVASSMDKLLIHESKDVLAAAAYSRVVGNRVLDFEVRQGKIIDKQTESSWNMFGVAEQGELAGTRLTKIDRGVYFSFVWLDFYPQSVIFGSR